MVRGRQIAFHFNKTDDICCTKYFKKDAIKRKREDERNQSGNGKVIFAISFRFFIIKESAIKRWPVPRHAPLAKKHCLFVGRLTFAGKSASFHPHRFSPTDERTVGPCLSKV